MTPQRPASVKEPESRPIPTRAKDRRRRRPANERFRTVVPLIAVWVLGLVIIGGAVLQDRVPSQDLFMDASHVGRRPWFTGMVAALGVIGWTVSVCGCFGAAGR